MNLFVQSVKGYVNIMVYFRLLIIIASIDNDACVRFKLFTVYGKGYWSAMSHIMLLKASLGVVP